MNIFLIGYRCTGKTSVGKSLANQLGRPFLDADFELMRQHAMTIKDMVAQYGWDFFRQKERAVIKRLSKLNEHVISTGGGVVLDAVNREIIKANGIAVWLKADPKTILKRMLQDKDTLELRPALTSEELFTEIETTLLSRKSYYQEVMDFSIDTDDMEIKAICSAIIRRIKTIGPKVGFAGI
ncbi:MAG: shikimate kinase [Desulfobacterales bacterium]|nr:shikimate kinase [Desulfobacterales bacterium]